MRHAWAYGYICVIMDIVAVIPGLMWDRWNARDLVIAIHGQMKVDSSYVIVSSLWV